MANLSIRKLDDKVYEKLHARAVTHGISMEEEVRQILSLATSAPARMADVFQKYFGRKQGIDLKLPHKHVPHDPIDFEE